MLHNTVFKVSNIQFEVETFLFFSCRHVYIFRIFVVVVVVVVNSNFESLRIKTHELGSAGNFTLIFFSVLCDYIIRCGFFYLRN